MLHQPHWRSRFRTLSFGVAQRAPTPTHSTDLGLNPKSYKKMPHLSIEAYSAFDHLLVLNPLKQKPFNHITNFTSSLELFIRVRVNKVWLNNNNIMLTTPVFFVILFILFWLVRWLGRVQVIITNTPRGSKLSPTVRGPPSSGSCDPSEWIQETSELTVTFIYCFLSNPALQ